MAPRSVFGGECRWFDDVGCRTARGCVRGRLASQGRSPAPSGTDGSVADDDGVRRALPTLPAASLARATTRVGAVRVRAACRSVTCQVPSARRTPRRACVEPDQYVTAIDSRRRRSRSPWRPPPCRSRSPRHRRRDGDRRRGAVGGGRGRRGRRRGGRRRRRGRRAVGSSGAASRRGSRSTCRGRAERVARESVTARSRRGGLADHDVAHLGGRLSPAHAPPAARQSSTTPLSAAADMLVPDWM